MSRRPIVSPTQAPVVISSAGDEVAPSPVTSSTTTAATATVNDSLSQLDASFLAQLRRLGSVTQEDSNSYDIETRYGRVHGETQQDAQSGAYTQRILTFFPPKKSALPSPEDAASMLASVIRSEYAQLNCTVGHISDVSILRIALSEDVKDPITAAFMRELLAVNPGGFKLTDVTYGSKTYWIDGSELKERPKDTPKPSSTATPAVSIFANTASGAVSSSTRNTP